MSAAGGPEASQTFSRVALAAHALTSGVAPEETPGITSEVIVEGVADGVDFAGHPLHMMQSRSPLPEAQVPSHGQVTAPVPASADGARNAGKACYITRTLLPKEESTSTAT